MMRASWTSRAARCLYNALGVSPSATTVEIKQAFRDRAKKTHPDIAGSADAARSFREMVEAYRVLRDPKRRAEYDREVVAKARASGHAQWPRRDVPEGMDSEAFRANLYGYQAGGGVHQGPMQGDAQYYPAGIRTEYAAVGVVMLAGVWFMLPSGKTDKSNYSDPDPYPNRRPGARPASISAGSTQQSAAVEGAKVASSSPSEERAAAAAVAAAVKPQGSSMIRDTQVGDELVAAFYNPFSEKWHRIPEGYEPPGAMDLTAWHKKRTDPVEWARLFAEGKLSQIIPRGGLQVRFRPAWDTFEPAIIKDPHTGKTVQMSEKLPVRSTKAACDVEF